jgi:hypothetical protein
VKQAGQNGVTFPRRVNTKGIKGANKHVLMVALTYNLRKFMKCCRPKAIAKAAQLPIQLGENLQLIYACCIASIAPIRGILFNK